MFAVQGFLALYHGSGGEKYSVSISSSSLPLLLTHSPSYHLWDPSVLCTYDPQ